MNIQERPEIVQRVNRGINYISPFLGEIIFENKCDKIRSVLPQDEYKVLRAVQMCGLDSFALHFFGRYLSEETRNQLKVKGIKYIGRMLRFDAEIKLIRDKMDAAGIPFVAFKGIDTAYRCYPLAAMRHMADMDVLFHKEDLPRAIEILKAIGWTPVFDFDNGHHLAEMTKEHMSIEPHYKIPLFPDEIQDELWDYVIRDDRGIRVFTPEVAFLILFLHMEQSKWGVYNRVRYIMDTSFHIKNLPPDWNLLAELERKWKLPDARVLPKVFSDIIPDELVPNDPPIDPELLETVTFLIRNNYLYPIDASERALSRGSILSKEWWKTSLLIFYPLQMRRKYDLPEHGAFCRLAAAYVRDVFSKIGKLFQYAGKRFKSAEAETPETLYLRKMRDYRRLTSQVGQGTR